MSKNVIFAIFGDNQFIAWTYGMFTQLVKYPKIYDNSERQVEVVLTNAKSKIRRLKEDSNLAHINPTLSIIDAGQNREKGKLENVSGKDDSVMSLWIAIRAAVYVNKGFSFGFA